MDPEKLAMALMQRDPGMSPELAHRLATNLIAPNSAMSTYEQMYPGLTKQATPGTLPPGYSYDPPVKPDTSLAPHTVSEANYSTGDLLEPGMAGGPGDAFAPIDGLEMARRALQQQMATSQMQTMQGRLQHGRDMNRQSDMIQRRDAMNTARSNLSPEDKARAAQPPGPGMQPSQESGMDRLARNRVAYYHQLMAKKLGGQPLDSHEDEWLNRVAQESARRSQ